MPVPVCFVSASAPLVALAPRLVVAVAVVGAHPPTAF